MIPSITEINFPSYATLHQATVSLQEMGERTITTQVRIDGDIVPDFSGWELEFKGERFVLPNTNPQALKDNTTRNSLVDLTFVSWPVEEMKRYFFMSLSEVETGVAIADQYKASVIMPVEQFVELFNRVLRYYFGNKVRIDLFQAGSHIYSENPVSVEINYSYIWDVLTKFYELFGLRWQIEYESASDTYVIKVGYSSEAIDDHDFEYGYSGGLLRFERQVQDADITNILLGRGGEKNLPYRYFKREDPQNPNWTPDPDAIYELRNIYFDKLRDANFRWYVRGWMKNENRDKTWENAGYSYPSYTDVPEEYQYAYNRGLTDARFNPVEFVRDADSIEKYGERWGALDDNDDVYPTIQGIERDPIGRVDEVVAVSEIVTDDVDAAAQSASTTATIGGALSVTQPIAKNSYKEYDFQSEAFTVPDGKTANLTVVWLALVNGGASELVRVDTSNSTMVVVNNETGTERPAAGIPAGTYHAKIHVRAYNDSSSSEFLYVTYGVSSLTAAYSDVNENAWKPTFDIWVKNIWETSQNQGESNADYSTRVWGKILGDRVGNEAKIVFSTGFMSISEDYEFTIASYPVVDRSKTINGVPSEWKITLYKSSAEFDATGLFIPNSQTGGKPIAGDKFFFIGIDMPFIYVRWAEEQLTAVKTESLEKTADINPTWVINLDKVRVHTIEDVDYGTALADRLASGSQIRIRDSRFTNGNILTLYVQSITYTWNEPSDGSPYLVPDIEVVLSDKVVSVESPVQKIQNSVDVIRSTYAKTADIESVVRRVASPLFLKKTGESDSSVSPTTFASRVSSKSFRQGDIGGEGWGYYEDGEGNATLELDRLIVRKDMTVNSLVANQISYVGGKQIFSAANIECTQVVDSDAGYVCYFDQKQGSVSNLFQVGDIAMGQVFDSENNEERYYRAVVTAVSDNSITLSKTQKDGAGIPEKGDIIVQYGNTSQSARQYVIIRDVIGGGYERMLSGLDSVTASGDEYYFAGRQSGSTPRVFIGDSENEYMEYANGVLNIKGRLSVMKTDGTYQSLAEYINNAAQINASLQEQIDGKIQTFYPQTGAPDDYVPALNNYPASSWVDASDKNKHVGDIFYNREGKAWRFNYDGTTWSWVSIADEEVQTALQEAERANQGVSGLEYLKEATNSGTLVDGGLVLTSLIQLGQASGSTFNVLSGINGVLDQTLSDPTRSIAAWYGGPMIDHEVSPSAASYAKSLFRMDGSGYLASGNIAWSQDGSGKIPGISWNGDSVIISGNVKLESLSGDSVTELTNYVRQLVNWFGEDADGNIFVRKNGENARGFYSYGFITAGGIGTSGGSGGGGLIETLHRYADLGGSFSDSANDTFNAYTINKINADLSARIAALEGGSATSITTTGSGNVITALSKSDTVITATKGITALTSHQTITLASGTNNGTLKLTTAAGTTDNIAVKGLAALAYKSSLAFSELTGKPTTLSGYGISDTMRVIVLEDNGTTTAGTWLAKSNPANLITSYTDGLVVLYKITKAGAATTTLNINGLGAKTVYRVGTTKLTTQYGVGSYLLLYYASGVGSGSFQLFSDYDANSYAYLRMYPTTGNVEYPLLARYNTTTGNSYYTEYGRYAVGVTLNPHEKSITASKFIVTDGTSDGFLKADGSIDSNVYALASALSDYYTKSQTNTQIGNAITALGLGSAAFKEVGSVASGNTGLVTGGDVHTAINTALSSAMKFEGSSSTAITDGGTQTPTIDGQTVTKYKGMVVLYGSKEFVWTGSVWEELGDEGSHALKTITISAGTGLTGGGDLSTNRTISLSASTIASLALADTALQSHQTIYALTIKNSAGTTQLTYTPNSGAGSLTLTKAMVGLANVENTALSTWAGTNKITTVGTITSGTWNGTAIANEYLANNSITIGSKSISLGGSATLTQIGVPAWAQASALAFDSLPKMYIAKNEVQSSSAVQNLTGLGNLEPDTGGYFNLGSSSKYWSNAYIYAARVGQIYGIEDGVSIELKTSIVGSVNLGSSSSRFANIYGVNGDLSGTLTVTGASTFNDSITIDGDIVPLVDDNYDLGSMSGGDVNAWSNVFTHNIYVDTIQGGTAIQQVDIACDLVPAADSQAGLGLVNSPFYHLYVDNTHTGTLYATDNIYLLNAQNASAAAGGAQKKIWFEGSTHSANSPYFEVVNIGTTSAPVWALHTNVGFYSDSFITAGGIGTSGGSGGGGLIETLHRYADLGGSFSDSANDTFNAYTINKINTDLAARITALEGGSATDVTTTGSGNVVSSVTKSGTTITVTKGITALTSHQSLDGYVNEIATGTGNYIKGVSKSGKKLTFTYGTLPTTIALSNVTGADDLKAIEALTGTSGLLKKTAANTWTLDTTSYATAASLGNYLPLTGGTLTGELDIAHSQSANDVVLSLSTDDTMARIGAGAADGSEVEPTIRFDAMHLYRGDSDVQYKIYDEGNLTKPVITNLLGSNTYAPYNADGYLPLSGGQMTGAITFLAGNSKTVGLQLTIAGGSVTNNMDIGWDWATGAGSGIALRSSTATGGAGAGGFDIYARSSTATANTKHLRGTAAGALSWEGSFTATSIKKSGGTSAQFLKADGSVDSSTYLTGITKSLVTEALGGTPSSMWYAHNGSAGYWKIHIKSTASWFLAFSINRYSDYTSNVIRVSGYNYASTKKWYNPRAFMVGSTSSNPIEVTFGMDGDRDLWVVVPVGSYNGISITDVVYGNAGAGLSFDADAFEITKITEIPETVTHTITVYPPLYLDGGTISGNLSVTGTLGVTGAATMSSSLSVSGDAEASTLTITNTSSKAHLAFSRNSANYISATGGSASINFVLSNASLSSANSSLIISKSDVRPGSNTIKLGTAEYRWNTIYGVDGNLSGDLTAASFIKSGGTASQFLKADGSVDANTYLTTGNASSTYLTIANAASTYVTALGVDGEDLTWTKNSVVNHITVPFAETVRDMKVEEMDDQVFTSRQTADGALTWNPSSALAMRIKGNTIVWNQLYNTVPTLTRLGVTISQNSDGTFTLNGTATSAGYFYLTHAAGAEFDVPTVGHKVFWRFNRLSKDSAGTFVFGTVRISEAVAGNVAKIATFETSPSQYLLIQVKSGDVYNNAKYSLNYTDLTLMFGSGKEPTTVEEFEEMYNLPYYGYNAGTLLSNAATGIETVGRNLYKGKSVHVANANSWPAFSKDTYTFVKAGTPYWLYHDALPVSTWRQEFKAYDLNGELITSGLFSVAPAGSPYYNANHASWIDGGNNSRTSFGFTFAQDCYIYLGFSNGNVTAATVLPDICLSISDSSLNGTYEPYWKRSLPLKLNTLKGKLNGTGESVVVFPDGLRSAGTVYDEIVGNRAIKRFGAVDLGTLTWAVASNGILYAGLDSVTREKQTTGITVVCSKYLAAENQSNTTEAKSNPDKSVCLLSTVGSTHRVYVYDSSYTDAAAFKTAMSGVMLYYELATPEEYILDEAIPTMMRVDRLGTESVYPANGEVPYTAPMRMDVQYGTRTGDIAGSIAEVRDSYLPLSGGALTGELSLTGSSKKLWFGDTYYIELVNIGTTANPQYALHTNAPLYSDGFITAGGVNANA